MNYNSDYEVRLATLEAMGGDVTKHYDSVYEIDLEILKLTEQGGGSTSAIEPVDALPEASENKEKLYRLSSDDNVYVSELKSRTSTTTNRLPDEEQIDKAYLYIEDYIYHYKGAWKFIFNDGELEGYGWFNDNEEEWECWFTQDNAVNVSSSSNAYSMSMYFEDVESIDFENHTITIDDIVSEYNWDYAGSLEDNGIYYVSAIYNAPESAQINWNATIVDDSYGDRWCYTGEEASVEDENGNIINGYKWESDSTPGYYIISTKKASEIYYFGLTEEDTAFNSDTMFYYDDGSQATLEYPSEVNICTLNASNVEQVGNAYFSSKEYSYHPARTYFYYYNNEVTVHCTDGDMLMYNWMSDFEVGAITLKEPTYIYRKVEAVSTESWTPGILEEETGEYIYFSTKSALISEFNSQNKIRRESDIPDILPDINGQIKYQRTETIEEWDWQPLTDNATNDDIDLMFASEIKLIRYQDAEQQAEGFQDWWVNTNGETMEYDGNTYYKWVTWATNDGAEQPVAYPKYVMLTNTLNISLPFNSESPEFEYTITYDSEEDTWFDSDYFHGDYTQKTVQ